MRKIWHRFQSVSKIVFHWIFLHLAYFFGVGVTSVVAKIFGKHFLNTAPTNSTWQKRNQDQTLKTMY